MSANSLSIQSLMSSTFVLIHFNLNNFLFQVPDTLVPNPALEISLEISDCELSAFTSDQMKAWDIYTTNTNFFLLQVY